MAENQATTDESQVSPEAQIMIDRGRELRAAEQKLYGTEDDPAPPEGEDEGQPAAEQQAKPEPTDGDGGDSDDDGDEQQSEAEGIGLARIARREKRARQEHERLKAELKAERDEFEKEKGQLEQFKQVVATALTNPVKVFKALGYTEPKQFQRAAQALWVEATGEDAPEAWREQVRDNSIEAEIAELRNELSRRDQADAQRQQQHQMQQQLRAYHASIADTVKAVSADDFPHVAAYAEADAAATTDALFQLAASAAEANPDGDAMTPDQLVEVFEENLKREFAIFGKLYGAPGTQAQEKEPAAKKAPARTPTTSLSNRKTQTGHPRQPRKSQGKTEDERLNNGIEILKQGFGG